MGDVTLEGVTNSSKGLGATPAGSLVRPYGNSTNKKSLYPSASARIETQGATVEGISMGTLTDVHNESVRT